MTFRPGLPLLAFLFSAFVSSAAADPQVVILKLDDVVAQPSANGPVSERWQRIADYLVQNRIKGSFGIICALLEPDNPAYFHWIKDLQAGGWIEFWLHGYHLKKSDEEPREFELGTAADQQAVLEKSARLAREKLGFPFAAFGPHWSGTNDATDAALEAVPDIRIWLYGPAKPKHFTRLSLERVLALENPTFVPDPLVFQSIYNQKAADRGVLVLQGHPNQWDEKRWAGFLEIIAFLQSKQVVFMTPSEYLQQSSNAR
jgi:peptidoglycan/xylan/chitin deacetylase (PgdA/CDA1 family)